MKITESADLAFLGIPSMSSQRILRIPCRYTMLHAHPQNQPWPKPEKKGHDLKTKLGHHRFKFLCKKLHGERLLNRFWMATFQTALTYAQNDYENWMGVKKAPTRVARSPWQTPHFETVAFAWPNDVESAPPSQAAAHESNLVTFPVLSIWNDRMSSTSNHKIDENPVFFEYL